MNISKEYAIPGAIGLIGVLAALLFMFIAPANASANERFGNGPHAVGSTLEVVINDSGSVLVRGAKVTAVSGSTITAQTLFGATALSWSVVTDANTKFLPRSATTTSAIVIADIKVGDYISFAGSLNTAVSGLVVNAKVVKDFSIATKPVEKKDKDHKDGKDNKDKDKKETQGFFNALKNRFGFHFNSK